MTLENRYQELLAFKSDIRDHLPILRAFSANCGRVVEMGVGRGRSTVGLLMGKPDWMRSYDVGRIDSFFADKLEGVKTDYRFEIGDSITTTCPPCDLLFLDTKHTFEQVSLELEYHTPVVSRWVIIHDTTTFGHIGEDGKVGIYRAITQFIDSRPGWRISLHLPWCNGLTILSRDPAPV